MKLFTVAMLILLSATLATPATFTVRWSDNSDNEDGFIVERNPVVDNNVLGDSSTFGEVGRVGKGVTLFIDNTPDNQKYCYQIKAFNAAGESGYTEVVCGVPFPNDPGDASVTVQ